MIQSPSNSVRDMYMFCKRTLVTNHKKAVVKCILHVIGNVLHTVHSSQDIITFWKLVSV